VLDQLCEICETQFRVEVEPQLGEFHGNFGGRAAGVDAFENAEVMLGDRFGFRAIADVFAETREDCADAAFREATGGSKGIVNIFTGKKARGSFSEEAIARRVVAELCAF